MARSPAQLHEGSMPAWRRFDLPNKAMQTDGRFAATADRQAVRPHKSEVGL